MGKFDRILLVSDFDDTLFTDDHKIPPRNLSALDYFTAQGGRFTVATGRSQRTFAPYASGLYINAPAILSNGAAIYDFQTNTMLEQTELPPCAPQDFQALFDAFPTLGVEVFHKEEIFAFQPNEITTRHMEKVGASYTCLPLAEMPLPWSKAILQQEHSVLLAAQAWFLQQFGGAYEAIFSNRSYLEITKKGSTKGGMVAKLAVMLGIQPDGIYCVGDNQNDIPMLALSRIPFAPGDCAQEVRDWGATLLVPCAQGVIGDIIERLDKEL